MGDLRGGSDDLADLAAGAEEEAGVGEGGVGAAIGGAARAGGGGECIIMTGARVGG